jgi:serine O-acetyltransferase
MFKLLAADLRACMERDPAARSKLEVVLVYPGFHALVFHRLSHGLWRLGLKLVARFLANVGRILTGIEIHPGARIGRGFFIDHGIGVVIGETAEIGDGVTLYHDVTLGGIAPSIDSAAQRGAKRHPTLMDNVIVGSGAQILGPITVGRGARVGANSVVLADVPSCATVVGIPARVVRGRTTEESESFQAYGVKPDLPDPVQRAVDALLDRVQSLQARVDELERHAAERSPTRWSMSDDLDDDEDLEPAPKRGVKN